MVRITRPNDARLRQILVRAAATAPTYDEIGATSSTSRPAGFHHFAAERRLGAGNEVFARAVTALRQWTPQKGAGLSLIADGPVAAGATVAMAAPLPLGFAIATCRVVYVEEDIDHFAFAYGTLPVHPECGEERFEISRADGAVIFRIRAFSRPRQLTARLAGPMGRWMQARATGRYLDAMERASTER